MHNPKLELLAQEKDEQFASIRKNAQTEVLKHFCLYCEQSLVPMLKKSSNKDLNSIWFVLIIVR